MLKRLDNPRTVCASDKCSVNTVAKDEKGQPLKQAKNICHEDCHLIGLGIEKDYPRSGFDTSIICCTLQLKFVSIRHIMYV